MPVLAVFAAAAQVGQRVDAALLDLAVRAAQAGAVELLSRAGRAGGVLYKSTATDPVSDADRAAEAAIVTLIAGERPEDGLFGEEGAALAVNAEARLDYFGQTVNIAARVQALAASGEIWMTEPVLAAEGVDLRFAEMKGPVKDRLRRYALYERFGDDHFSPTVGAAVSAYLATTGVEWTDWEDRPAPTHPGRR